MSSAEEFRKSAIAREDESCQDETAQSSIGVRTEPKDVIVPRPRISQRPVILVLLLAAGVLLLGSGGLLWIYLQDSSPGAGQAEVRETPTPSGLSPPAGADSGGSAVLAEGPSSRAPSSQVPSESPLAAVPAETSADSLLAEGGTLYREKRYGEAIDRLEEAVRLDPGLAEAHYYLGMAYYQFTRYMEAVQCFQGALTAKSDYAEAYAGLGMAYYQLDQNQDALQALEQAVNLDNKLTEARYYLGLAYLGNNDQEQALRQYQALQGMDPEKAKLLNEKLQQQATLQEAPPERGQETVMVPTDVPPSQQGQPPVDTPPQFVQPPATAPYSGDPRWPWTSQRLATEGELATLTFEDLRLMRNEILARHGWVFRNVELKEYFQRQPWYRPRGSLKNLVATNRAILKKLNPTERQNNTIILRHEMMRKLRKK